MRRGRIVESASRLDSLSSIGQASPMEVFSQYLRAQRRDSSVHQSTLSGSNLGFLIFAWISMKKRTDHSCSETRQNSSSPD